MVLLEHLFDQLFYQAVDHAVDHAVHVAMVYPRCHSVFFYPSALPQSILISQIASQLANTNQRSANCIELPNKTSALRINNSKAPYSDAFAQNNQRTRSSLISAL